jgi:hypothetical protein
MKPQSAASDKKRLRHIAKVSGQSVYCVALSCGGIRQRCFFLWDFEGARSGQLAVSAAIGIRGRNQRMVSVNFREQNSSNSCASTALS